MKYLILLSFFLVAYQTSFSQNKKSYIQSDATIILSTQFPKIEVDNQITNVLEEVHNKGSYCFNNKKGDIFYLVSVNKMEDYFYCFIRPWYSSNSPDLIEYGIFGATIINNIAYLFYGLKDNSIFPQLNNNQNSEQIISFKYTTAVSNPISTTILCDGCSEKWCMVINGNKILIDAEVCHIDKSEK